MKSTLQKVLDSKPTLQEVLDSTDINQLIDAGRRLAETLGLQSPCRASLEYEPLEIGKKFEGDEYFTELFSLGMNELSIAKACALNVIEIVDETGLHENARQELSKGFARQCIEEIDHSITTFRAIERVPGNYKFSVYNALRKEKTPTRVLLVLILELRELKIRPPRISVEKSARGLTADRLALIDDLNHIRWGARALSLLMDHGHEPDLDQTNAILKKLDKTSNEKRIDVAKGFEKVLLSRLDISKKIWDWVLRTEGMSKN